MEGFLLCEFIVTKQGKHIRCFAEHPWMWMRLLKCSTWSGLLLPAVMSRLKTSKGDFWLCCAMLCCAVCAHKACQSVIPIWCRMMKAEAKSNSVKWVWFDGIITPSALGKQWWCPWEVWCSTVRCHMAVGRGLSTACKIGQEHCNWTLLPLELCTSWIYGLVYTELMLNTYIAAFPKVRISATLF